MSQMTDVLFDQSYFERLSGFSFKHLKENEFLDLAFDAERSHFVRLNSAKVRQVGIVQDSNLELSLTFQSGKNRLHKASQRITLTGLSYEDQSRLESSIRSLQEEVRLLPLDPYVHLPSRGVSSSVEKKGRLPSHDSAIDQILEPLDQIDIAGIFASGPLVRAMANSVGLRHWFYTESFSLDYSLYTAEQQALKSTFAGQNWDSDRYREEIQSAHSKLSALNQKTVQVPRGNYRVYLAPAAVAELIAMFSWGGVSEASIRQGDSPLRLLRTQEKTFSPQFNLSEDFRGGEVPRFNSKGELASEHLVLIDNGTLAHSLVSSRTAKEYGVPTTYAEASETLRAASMAGGQLDEHDILNRLGTGLYLSNLHYLNWSDQPGGRVTGMTRYACFWVENGRIIAPIERMRFDENLFSLFGGNLEELTRSRVLIPDVSTYSTRNLGGTWCPGMLVSQMNFSI